MDIFEQNFNIIN